MSVLPPDNHAVARPNCQSVLSTLLGQFEHKMRLFQHENARPTLQPVRKFGLVFPLARLERGDGVGYAPRPRLSAFGVLNPADEVLAVERGQRFEEAPRIRVCLEGRGDVFSHRIHCGPSGPSDTATCAPATMVMSRH